MKFARLVFAALLFGFAASGFAAQRIASPEDSFTVQGDHFLLDGKPFQIISGEMHYERIPRAYWRARLRMARAMGLNTVATYVFWNIHEPQPGVFHFSGNADLAEFIREAQQEGLKVLLRAGPYSCAEWEFGGFPAWLMKDPRMKMALRSNDPAFMVPVEQWIMRLGREVAPLQIGRGGPILAVQIENEYGDFGADHAYLEHLHQIFLKAGFSNALLYTADPSHALGNGSIPGVFAAVNFGIGHAQAGLDALAHLRPGQPLFASEYWPGWFDHWGQPHQTRPIAPQIADLDYILRRGAGINIYMFHGGTSFGMMSGSSWTKNQFWPDVTSYDYDAPLDEAGHPTPKYDAYRAVIAKYLHQTLPPVPTPPPAAAVPVFTLKDAASLWDGLPQSVESQQPQPMENFGQAYGFILYRATLHHAIHGELDLHGLNDYALVYLNEKLTGTLDRTYVQTSLRLDSDAPENELDILVENSGRINSTRMMRGENKGLSGPVNLAGEPVEGWQIFSLPMNPASIVDPPQMPVEAHFTRHANVAAFMQGPAFYRGVFNVKKVSGQVPDTFLDVRDLGKGAVWINGYPIGRYWNIQPQATLYVPGPWLRAGKNEIVVLDLFARTHLPKLAGLSKPILDEPVKPAN
jgi:beta-galactosidase